MNDEEAFQSTLDADPSNHTLRMVFADWLDDRGDERATGYRELGRLYIYPYWDYAAQGFGFGRSDNYANRTPPYTEDPKYSHALLDPKWFLRFADWKNVEYEPWWTYRTHRRDIEDLAARAFSRDLTRTDSDYLQTKIAEARATICPGYGMTRDGYTRKSGAPTEWLIRLVGEKRWRRLMIWQFSNNGTLFVRIKGKALVVRENQLPL